MSKKSLYYELYFRSPIGNDKIVSFLESDWQPLFQNSDSSNYLVFTHIIKQTAHWVPNLTRESHESVDPLVNESLWGRHWAWTKTWETRAQGPCCGYSSAKPSQPLVAVPSSLPGHAASTIKHHSAQWCWPQVLLLSLFTRGTQCCSSIVCTLKSMPSTWLLCFKKETGMDFLMVLQRSAHRSKATACVSLSFSCPALSFYSFQNKYFLRKDCSM